MKFLIFIILLHNSHGLHYDIGILQSGNKLISDTWIELTKNSINRNENVTLNFKTIKVPIDVPSLNSIRQVNDAICTDQLTLLISTDTCSKTFESLLSNNFPVIRINSSAECDITRKNSFNLPNTMTTEEILLKILKGMNMSFCSIVIDSSTSEYLFYKLKDAILFLSIKCKIIKIQDSDSDEKLRKYIESMESNNLEIFKASTFKKKILKNNNILLCSLRNIERLIDQINYIEEYRMFTKGAIYHNRWLIIREGPIENILVEVAKKIKDVDNFAALSIIEPKYITLESRFQDTVFKLYSILEDVYNDPSYKISKISCTPYYTDRFNDLLHTSFNQKDCGRFKLYYYPPYSKKFKETVSCVNDVELLNFNIFPNEQYGFNGRKMTIATLPFSPFVMKKKVHGKVIYSGVCIDLLNEFAYLLNFTYDVIEPVDRQWGRSFQNGSFTGLVGIMQKREADLLFAPLSVTDERKTVMDFSSPYYFEYSTAIIKLPGENEGKWKVITEPFRWEVWLCIVMSVPFTGIIAWLITKISLHLMHGTPLFMEDIFKIWDKSMWYVFGALLTQGGAYQPRTMPGRTVIAFWWCFSIVMVATYSGNLIAFLTVSKQEIPFKSLETLVETNNYKWGVLGGTFYVDYLRNSSDPIIKKLYSKMIEFYEEDRSVLDTVFSNHLQKLKDEKYTMINDKTSLDYEVIQDCTLSTISEKFIPFPYAVGMQKGSHLYRALDELLLALRAGGIIQFWHNKHWPKDKGCTSLNQPTSKPVTILDVQSAFYILLGGLFISLLILIYELIKQKYFPEKLLSKTIKIEIKSNEKPTEKKLSSHTNETVVTRHTPKMNNLFLPD